MGLSESSYTTRTIECSTLSNEDPSAPVLDLCAEQQKRTRYDVIKQKILIRVNLEAVLWF